MTFIRFLRLLSLAVWLGALVFFPVVAETSFAVLPSRHWAGFIVRDSLVQLHWMGLLSGMVFLAASLVYKRLALGRPGWFSAEHLLIGMMLILTSISQFGIIPRMDLLRITGGDIDLLSPSNPIRAQFDSLHAWSVRVEQTVLLLALVVLYRVVGRGSSAAA
jgi:Domain of unknown function (DUF4149)